MKYIANPVEVTAYKILHIGEWQNHPQKRLPLVIGDADGQSESQQVYATAPLISRMEPKIGDYWVIQSDGYIYLNPKEVFERKYHAAE